MDATFEFRYLVLAAQREGARALGALLKPLGITPSQAEVLTLLAQTKEALSIRDIGDRLVCESGSPSRLISSMVDRGLVTCKQAGHDRRANEVKLTAEGRKAAKAVTKVEDKLHAQIVEQLGPRGIASASKVLRSYVDGTIGGEALERRRNMTA